MKIVRKNKMSEIILNSKLRWSNGNVYMGSIISSETKEDLSIRERKVPVEQAKPHGNGRMVYEDGHIYDGEWEKGVRHGNGIMTFTSGNVYTYKGSWVNGKMEGNGILQFFNGDEYIGGMMDGVRHGNGVLTRLLDEKITTVFNGNWEMDRMMNGKFRSLPISHEEIGITNSYKARIKNGFLHGIGKLYRSDGTKILIKFKHGVRVTPSIFDKIRSKFQK